MSQKESASFIILSSSTTTERHNEEDKNSEHVLFSFYKPMKNRASRSVPSRRIQSPYVDPNLGESKFTEDDSIISSNSNNNALSNAKRMQKLKPLPPVPPKSSSFAVIETRKDNSFLQGQTPPPLPKAPKPKVIPKGRSRTASDPSNKFSIESEIKPGELPVEDYPEEDNTPIRKSSDKPHQQEPSMRHTVLLSPPVPNRPSPMGPRARSDSNLRKFNSVGSHLNPFPATGQVFNVHLILPDLDVFKKIRVESHVTVKQLIEIIMHKANLKDRLAQYMVVIPNFYKNFSGEEMIMEENQLVSFYGLSDNENLIFKCKPHPLASRLVTVTVISLEGKSESLLVNPTESVSQLLNLACLKFNYARAAEIEMFLYNANEEVKRMFQVVAFNLGVVTQFSNMKEQGITQNSLVVLRKKSKKEIIKQRASMANIKKKVQQESDQGVESTLQAIEDFNTEKPAELSLKKGDKIVVLQEDETGWWKGRVGEKVGIFPVQCCKYLNIERSNHNQAINAKLHDELQQGLVKFSQKLKRNPSTSTSSMDKLKFWKSRGSSAPQLNRFSQTVPRIVEEILNYLELRMAFKEEGFFRISGDLKEIWEIKKRFEQNKPIMLTKYNIHTVGGALKQYLRDLQDPLFTFELYDCFVAAVRIADERGRDHCIKQGLNLLPPCNKEIIRKLFAFFKLIVENQETTKMNAKNVAIVFAPSLIRPEHETLETMMSEDTKLFLECLIEKYDEFFVKANAVRAQMPSTPEFDAALKHCSFRIEESNKRANVIASDSFEVVTAPPSPSMRSSGVVEEVEISAKDLIDCLLEGNMAGVEQYLDTIESEERKEQLRAAVADGLHTVMKERGIKSQ